VTLPKDGAVFLAVNVKYDRTTISLHWITAGLVAVLWIIGQTADWLPDGVLNTDYWSIHVVLGFALAAVIAWRMIWRNSGGSRLPAADAGVLQVVAKATHYGLYLLLLVVVVLGLVNAFVRGYNLFDLVSLPQVGDRAVRKPITHWHGFAANLLLGLAGLHAAAALFHHYILRDSVLARMVPTHEA
jgi:cytochrome b561